MFWVIAAILAVLWTLGLVSGATSGAWIHLFLGFAVASVALAVARGPRSL